MASSTSTATACPIDFSVTTEVRADALYAPPLPKEVWERAWADLDTLHAEQEILQGRTLYGHRYLIHHTTIAGGAVQVDYVLERVPSPARWNPCVVLYTDTSPCPCSDEWTPPETFTECDPATDLVVLSGVCYVCQVPSDRVCSHCSVGICDKCTPESSAICPICVMEYSR